jgi:hypothetical protein
MMTDLVFRRLAGEDLPVVEFARTPLPSHPGRNSGESHYNPGKNSTAARLTGNVMLQLLHPIALSCVLSATGLPAVAAESSCGEFSGLRFPRSGVVRRDMVFRSFPQPCLYVETPTKWSTDWRRMGALRMTDWRGVGPTGGIVRERESHRQSR